MFKLFATVARSLGKIGAAFKEGLQGVVCATNQDKFLVGYFKERFKQNSVAKIPTIPDMAIMADEESAFVSKDQQIWDFG